jgi:acetyl esterase/lipase
MKKILFVPLMWLLAAGAAFSQIEIPLWVEGKMPNTKGMALQDSIAQQRLYRVGTPRMYAYIVPEEKNTGAAVLFVPGGGYVRLPSVYGPNDHIAKYFNDMGINVFILCHRLPTSPDLVEREKGAWQDGQRAMRIIRARAGEWGIDTTRVGVSGASAGGHVATTLATHFADVSGAGDRYDHAGYIPDFMVLISAVVSTQPGVIHRSSIDNLLGADPTEAMKREYSNELQISDRTPPTFFVHADNDGTVSSLNSVVFYEGLKARRIPSSLHIFPQGGHGFGVGGAPGSTRLWPDLCREWLIEMKIIPGE